MAQSSQKRRISVTIDTDLLAAVDQLTDNRSAAFEEALKLWRAHRFQSQLKKFYQGQLHPTEDESLEGFNRLKMVRSPIGMANGTTSLPLKTTLLSVQQNCVIGNLLF